MKEHLKSIVNFFYEVGILAKTPRSGFHFLRSGEQSVAEHIHRVVHIGTMLATVQKNLNVEKVMKMCLFHDIAEARTSDLNYVHQKYVASDELKAVQEMAETLKFDHDILAVLQEMKEQVTPEALLAKDADQLEWILSLREEVDAGSKKAADWIPTAVQRLKTDAAKHVAEIILTTHSDEWWHGGKPNDSWWVERTQAALKDRW